MTIHLNPPGNRTDAGPFFLAADINQWNPRDTAFQFVINRQQLQKDIIFYDSISLQFKITKGDWKVSESDPEGYPTANHIINVFHDTTITINVSSWTGELARKHTASPNVFVLSDSFPMQILHSSRKVWIYLPPAYYLSKRHFPVIYMQDGQNLFDRATTAFGTEWKVDETMDSLIQLGNKEYIIVGIGAGEERLQEYLPFNSKQIDRPKGKEYGIFVVNELVPYVDGHFRTVKSSHGRSIAGSSMGAVISLYIAGQFPGIFGSAGLFSGAYWVIEDADKLLVKSTSTRKLRVFLSAGDAEASSMVSETEKIRTALLLNRENKVKTIYVKGGKHNEYYWQRSFLDFILWLQK